MCRLEGATDPQGRTAQAGAHQRCSSSEHRGPRGLGPRRVGGREPLPILEHDAVPKRAFRGWHVAPALGQSPVGVRWHIGVLVNFKDDVEFSRKQHRGGFTQNVKVPSQPPPTDAPIDAARVLRRLSSCSRPMPSTT